MMHTESSEIDNPEADLFRHVDGRIHVRPTKSDEGRGPVAAGAIRSSSPALSDTRSRPGSPDPEGGGYGIGHGAANAVLRVGSSAAKRTTLATYSEREKYVVAISRRLLYLFYVTGSIFAAIVLWQLVAQRSQKHVVAWSVAAIFVAIAVPFSLHDIHMHCMHYVCPKLQKYYIRILWMVPIYSIESWLALRFKAQKIYLETAREAYEAYVIYNVYMLMLNYLGGGQAVRDILKGQSDAGKKWVRLIFPFCCWRWKRSGQFINRSTVGVLQYVIIRFFCAFISCLVEYLQLVKRGNQGALDRTMTAIIIIINCAQIWAMYCLVLFYHELKYELRDISPLGKFLVVKTVVFLSFWQGLGIMGLAYEGYINSYMDYSKDDVASGIQDFLICVEMAAISYAHKFVFSYKDMEVIVKPEDMIPRPPLQAWFDIMPTDVMQDFREHLFGGFGLVHKLQKKAKSKATKVVDTLEAAIGAGDTDGEQE